MRTVRFTKVVIWAALLALPFDGGVAKASEYVLLQKAPSNASSPLSSSNLASLSAYGIKVVTDYGPFAIGSYEGLLDQVNASREAGVTVIPAPGFNLVRLAGVEIDTRDPEAALGALSKDLRLADYAAGVPGLYVIQLIGPPKEEWLKTLNALGVARVQYVDTNAYIVRAAAGLAALKGRLPWFVRFVMLRAVREDACRASGSNSS